MDVEVREDPRDSNRWRRFPLGCPFYRVRWFLDTDPEEGEPMYQVYCLQGTPAETWEENERCISSKTRCWRTVDPSRQKKIEPVIPIEAVTRRQAG